MLTIPFTFSFLKSLNFSRFNVVFIFRRSAEVILVLEKLRGRKQFFFGGIRLFRFQKFNFLFILLSGKFDNFSLS